MFTTTLRLNTVGTVIICNFGSQFVEQVKSGSLFPDFGIVAGPEVAFSRLGG